MSNVRRLTVKNALTCLRQLSAMVAYGLALWLFYEGCEQPVLPETVFQNPHDTLSPAFVAPRTTFTSGPASGSVATISTVTFTWSGTEHVRDYSWKVDDRAWSKWSSVVGVTLEYLDEGQHSFSVRARHDNLTTIEEDPRARSFTVDAVQGPGLRFYPLSMQTGLLPFDYEIWAEEVPSLYAARISVAFDPAVIQVDSVVEGSMMTTNGGSALILSQVDNTGGNVLIELASIGRVPRGVGGSGAVLVLQCRPVGTSAGHMFTFVRDEIVLRDTTNVTLAVGGLAAGRVVVTQ